MQGLVEVFRKELADAFTGKRFAVLFSLILLAGVFSAYVAAQGIKPVPVEGAAGIVSGTIPFVFLRLFTTGSGALPSFQTFIMFLIPIVGISLGFDAINREKAHATMSRLLAQPIYRDTVINGKFLAGVVTIAIMLTSIFLIVSGLGLRQIGVIPSSEEAARIFIYLITSILYGAFWLGLAMLFSILFERTATSALVSIAVWIFFAFFMGMISGGIADWLVPVKEGSTDATLLIRNLDAELMVSRFSPVGLFQEAGVFLLEPFERSLGAIPSWLSARMIPNPISMTQSLLIVWPHLIGLITLTVVCFAISYIKFIRDEIRAT